MDSHLLFDADRIVQLLQLTERDEVIHVAARESSDKEFKESFGTRSIPDYARTMAAFANNRGGYIFFGIADRPKTLSGLRGQAAGLFENLDPTQITTRLNELFSPEIRWDFTNLTIVDRSIGVLYTHESTRKPVVAKSQFDLTTSSGTVREGDIYYRYSGKTERIKFPELVGLLEYNRNAESKAIMKHIEGLVRAGASNAAILNLDSGELSGGKGQRLMVDQETLKKVSFIREGTFSEVEGAPTLRLVGDVVRIDTVYLPGANGSTPVTLLITLDHIFTGFFTQDPIGETAQEYIRYMCDQAIAWLPIQYFRRQAGLSLRDLITFIEGLPARSNFRTRVTQRLKEESDCSGDRKFASSTHSGSARKCATLKSMVDRDYEAVTLESLEDQRIFLAVVSAMTDDEIIPISGWLLSNIHSIFTESYGIDAQLASHVRRAACRVDHAVFAEGGPGAIVPYV